MYDAICDVLNTVIIALISFIAGAAVMYFVFMNELIKYAASH